MRLPSLEPRHDQICSWSLTTQPSLQVIAQQQQQQKILEVNSMLFFFFFNKKQLNTILFYLIKLSISYKEYKKIIIKILQKYSTSKINHKF